MSDDAGGVYDEVELESAAREAARVEASGLADQYPAVHGCGLDGEGEHSGTVQLEPDE